MRGERYQEVEISGELYRVSKMDAFAASALLKFLVEKCMPIFQALMDVNGEGEEGEDEIRVGALFKVLPPLLAQIDDKDLEGLMKRCLRYSEKKLKAGWQQVWDGKDWGVEDIEYDVNVCLSLVVNAMMFNISGFFGESGLTSQVKTAITSLQKP